MKKQIFIPVLSLLLLVVSSTSCVVVNQKHKTLPPGQAKKITGSKSAKPYAPGQKKKH